MDINALHPAQRGHKGESLSTLTADTLVEQCTKALTTAMERCVRGERGQGELPTLGCSGPLSIVKCTTEEGLQ